MVGKLTEDVIYRNKIHIFKDRLQAGKLLAEKLAFDVEDIVLLAIPSGGVPITYIISKELRIDFDLILVRKLQIPWNTEAGFGAVSWDGENILNEGLIFHLGLAEDLIKKVIKETLNVIDLRNEQFRGNKPFPNLEQKKVIIVDDGLASGYTMLAAVKSVRKRKPKRITVAIPTASSSSINSLLNSVEEIICINIRGGGYFAVADAYVDWNDLSDEEVMRFLSKNEKKKS
jgi:putative phosphoribosyl transferase